MALAGFALGGAPAYAADGEAPRLVKVTAESHEAIHELEGRFDIGYFADRNEAAVYVTDAEEAQLRALGYKIGEVVEDGDTWEARKAEIAATKEAESLAGRFAKNGVARSGVTVKGKKLVPTPGETVVMRAYTFTNYAGRFLYVEAHNKAHQPNVNGPATQMSYAGPDGTFTTPANGTRFSDGGQYMYHRYLVSLRGAYADVPTSEITVRVASASGSNDTATPIEWAGSALPPRIAEFQKDFITKYMDPTEVYDRFDEIAEQYPAITDTIMLPNKTPGYQRAAMAMMAGTTAPGSNPSTAGQSSAVQLFSKAMGHEGGNDITAEFRNPGEPNAPLLVSVDGKDITVSLATNASGAPASTAAQVRDAINAHAGASALVNAHTYGTNAGAGVAPARARVQLSDYLAAPEHVKRGPFDHRMLRIGTGPVGEKTGVFIYCQQHAREWVTPITCLETAERLVRNYANDPTTKTYVDNLDIFILPSVNPDGGHYSFYDFGSKRRNMSNYCLPGEHGSGNVGNRNSWGVDLNRNNTVGTLFDGYSGASSSCTSDTYAGPFEGSEPEIKNELWVVDTFPKIKFAINIHTHGGYFMWAPGAYKSQGRETLPAPNIGIEKYFFDVSETILSHIKDFRGTVIPPDRTGPIADVLYSAAGNSADDQWYRKGIIAYSFEAGAERFSVNQNTGAITRTSVGFQPCFGGPGTSGSMGSSCGTVSNPNALLVNEGHDSTMEFADGNYGLLQGALEYSQDVTAPNVDIEYSAAQTNGEPINYRFKWLDESAVIHYTTDGSTPTTNSPTYESQGARRPGEVLTLSEPGAYTIKWIAVDIKGNVSEVKSQRLLVAADDEQGDVGGNVPATLSLSLGAPASFGSFIPGVTNTYTASTSANVVSTAGDATLSVADPSATRTGHLVNGAFFLPQKLQASASSLAGTGGAFAPVGGAADPTALLSYGAPTSNDPVTVSFRQQIAANDALRTGAYGKTLTFTLSTTTP
jgi:hypothetical protein